MRGMVEVSSRGELVAFVTAEIQLSESHIDAKLETPFDLAAGRDYDLRALHGDLTPIAASGGAMHVEPVEVERSILRVTFPKMS